MICHLFSERRRIVELEVNVSSVGHEHDAAGDSGQYELRLAQVKLSACCVESRREEHAHDSHQQQARIQMSCTLHAPPVHITSNIRTMIITTQEYDHVNLVMTPTYLVEFLFFLGVGYPSGEECAAQHEQHVGQNGAEERQLHHPDHVVPQREHADDHLRRVAEGGVQESTHCTDQAEIMHLSLIAEESKGQYHQAA